MNNHNDIMFTSLEFQVHILHIMNEPTYKKISHCQQFQNLHNRPPQNGHNLISVLKKKLYV